MKITYRTKAEREWLENLSQGNPEQFFRNIIDAMGRHFRTYFGSNHLNIRIIPHVRDSWGLCCKSSYYIILCVENDFIPTVLHELIHVFYPDWEEDKVEQIALDIFKRDVINAPCEGCRQHYDGYCYFFTEDAISG